MWHVLRTELIYFRPWLFGALGIGGGAVVFTTVLNQTVGDVPGQVAAGIRGIFFVTAPMIAGFVAQNQRREERRARLLMTGPLTPFQLGGVMVLLPLCLIGLGAVTGGSVIAAETLIARTFELEAGGRLGLEGLHVVGYVGWMVLMTLMMPLLGQEAVAAHRQRRVGSAAAGWATLVAGVLVSAALSTAAFTRQVYLASTSLHLGFLVVAVAVTAASVALYARRTDFTQ